MMAQLQSIDEIVAREAVPSSERVRDRFGTIDGLRAIAILALLGHEIVRLAPTLVAHNAFAAAVAADASQGFTLFLILSGFTLAYPAIVTRSENGRAYLDIARFAIKRVLRIFPAYLFALALGIVLPPLAVHYGLAGFPAAPGSISLEAFWRNAIFAGDGLGNGGFIALGVIARCYLVFPLLLLLWERARRFFPAVFVAAIGLDLVPALHGIGIAAVVPFGLGIVAAEVRAAALPAYRFGIPLALLAGWLALRFGHPADLAPDPLWAMALFGIVVAAGASHFVERILSFPPVRLLGVTAFAISLVFVPVSAFVFRQTAGRFGDASAALNALAASTIVGFALFQLVDRSFGDGRLRREAAALIGPGLAAMLEPVRAHRIVLGVAAPVVVGEIAETRMEVAFYAPPPRADASDLAIVSTRTGSPEDLAADILATKKRLSERSAAFFAAAPGHEAVMPEKPGFYRKPKVAALSTAAAQATEPIRDAVAANRTAITMRVNALRDGAPAALSPSYDRLAHD